MCPTAIETLLAFSLLRGRVICIPIFLPASTSANTPAKGNQRFYLWTESLWILVTKPGRMPPMIRDQPISREKMRNFMAKFLKCAKFHGKCTEGV